MDTLITHESTIRISIFLGALIVLALWEILAKRKLLTANKLHRWFNNLSLIVLNTVVLRLAFPIAAVGAASIAHHYSFGLFNQIPESFMQSNLIEVVLIPFLAVVLLDAAIYFQHRLFHWMPMLWQLHRTHHADVDIDVTTGIRFHPIEILLSMAIKIIVVALLGAPVVAVILFEIILNAAAMFNHANIRLPQVIDKYLRYIIVTPDMHRVHHSIHPHEFNSNFGFNLAIWDRLFKTYKAQPDDGHDAMKIGLSSYRDKQWIKLHKLLLIPFKNTK